MGRSCLLTARVTGCRRLPVPPARMMPFRVVVPELIWDCATLVLQWQGNPSTISSRQIGCNQDFQGVECLSAIGVRLRLSPERLDDVVVVRWMAESVYRSRLITRLLDAGIVRIGVGKFPVIDTVDRYTSNPHRSALPNDGDGSFQVLGVGQHGHVHGSERAGAPPDADDP